MPLVKNQIVYFLNNKWLLFSFTLVFILLCPIISIFFSSLKIDLPTWKHLISTKIGLYTYNTLILLIGVGLTSLFIGLSSAWIIAKYNFPFSKLIEWALILPLAIPTYIVAYSYTDFLEYSGFVQTFVREIFLFENSKDYYFPEIRSMGGAIFVMSFVLYPYIYLISKIAFLSTPISLYDLAKMHGKSTFFNVALPMSRPAIVAGLSLVLMETISDFGTVEFFAVETLTLGIFNLWLGMNNLSAALINAQLPELNSRIEKGRRNHDFTAERLNKSPWISVPAKLMPEERAPDSIQFNLINLDTDEIDLFEKITSQSGLNVQIFGRTKDNARAFWNWQFLPETFELPKTRKMLMSACDIRLPSRLSLDECKAISDVILSAISTIKSGVAA